MKYQIKAIVSGNVVEVYKFGTPVFTGKDLKTKKKGSEKLLDTSQEDLKAKMDKSLKDSLRRTRNSLRRLINANAGKWNERDKFFTLTFKENVTDHEIANAKFRSFIKKLNYFIFKKHSGLKYVAVVERQQRGALHYHVIFFNLPYVPHADLLKIWGHGGVRINAIDHVDNVGVYVVKYIEKTMRDLEADKSAKEKDKKLYFSSNGLHKPAEISDGTSAGREQLEKLMKKTKGHEVFRKEYDNEYYEKFEVIQYNLNRNGK